MLKRALVLMSLVFTVFTAQAEEAKYQEGVHYTVLSTPLKTTYRGSDIGEIMEFFSYSCIHCFNLEPAIERYLKEKPDNILFSPVPVMFNERQAPEVRAYYVQKLLKLEGAHEEIFKGIHLDRKALRSDDAFAEFFEKNLGVDKEKYLQTAFSFGVAPQVQRSVYLTGNSGISGTPSIIANGKYLIDSGKVGGSEQALYVAQWLIQRDAAEATQ